MNTPHAGAARPAAAPLRRHSRDRTAAPRLLLQAAGYALMSCVYGLWAALLWWALAATSPPTTPAAVIEPWLLAVSVTASAATFALAAVALAVTWRTGRGTGWTIAALAVAGAHLAAGVLAAVVLAAAGLDAGFAVLAALIAGSGLVQAVFAHHTATRHHTAVPAARAAAWAAYRAPVPGSAARATAVGAARPGAWKQLL